MNQASSLDTTTRVNLITIYIPAFPPFGIFPFFGGGGGIIFGVGIGVGRRVGRGVYSGREWSVSHAFDVDCRCYTIKLTGRNVIITLVGLGVGFMVIMTV